MRKRESSLWLALILSVSMIIAMLPTYSFAAGASGSVEDDRYRIVALNGYDSRFNFSEVLIGQSLDPESYDVATPGFAYVGDTYNYVLQVDGVRQESGVTWQVTENAGIVSFASGALDKSVLTFECLKAGTVTIIALMDGQQVRQAKISVGNEVASGSCGNDITWKLTKGRELILSGSGAMNDYNKKSSPWYQYRKGITSVNIDSRITHIGTYAFENVRNVDSFVLPQGLISIGEGAFRSCHTLKSLDIPENVKSIGSYAFERCSRLRSVSLPNRLRSIEAYTFNKCIALKSIYVPDALESIGEHAFYECDSITNFALPENLKSMGNYVFAYCDKLQRVTFPDTLKSIPNSAFNSCPKLNNVVIGNNITDIGSSAFYNCDVLSNIKLPEGLTKMGNYVFADCDSLRAISIPASLDTISPSAFYGCELLSEVAIPEGVSTIGRYAFSHCDSLIAIELPDSLKTINYDAFSYSKRLKKVAIPDSVTSLDSSVFEGCTGLESVDLPAGIDYISSHLFSNSGIRRITVPGKITSIGNRAFYGCSELTEIQLPEGLESISSYAFYNCPKLRRITVPANVNHISGRALGYTKDDKADPDFVIEGTSGTRAESYAKANGLRFVELSTGPVTIDECTIADIADQVYTGEEIIPVVRITDPNGKSLVQGTDFTVTCSNNIAVGEATVVISGNGSSYIGSLTRQFNIVDNKIDISKCTVGDIADQEFTGEAIKPAVVVMNNGAELTLGIDYTVRYADNVQTGSKAKIIITGCGEYSGEFVKTFTIKKPYVDKGFCGLDGKENIEWVLTEDGTLTLTGSGAMENFEMGDQYSNNPVWYEYEEKINTVVIGEGITTIGANAFRRLYQLSNLKIANSVTDIGHDAFLNCSSLKSVVIPAKVKNIYGNAFAGCNNLSSVQFDKGIEAIGTYAFANCTALKNLDIPDSVTMIGSGAFAGSGLKTIELPAITDKIRDSLFSDCRNLEHIQIPERVNEIGRNAFANCANLEQIEIPGNVTSINSWAFAGCTSLENILIPNRVQIIGYEAFSNCTSLVKAELGESVSRIEREAFNNCKSLKSVNIPKAVSYIDYHAFFGCESLKRIEIPANTDVYNRALGFYQNTLSGEESVVNGFSIYGYKYSRAESYAKENGIPFNYICDHDLETMQHIEKVERKDASCNAAGNNEYYRCTECGNLYTNNWNGWQEVTLDDVTINASGHSWDYASGKDSDGYYHCFNCDAVTRDDPELKTQAALRTINSVPQTISAAGTTTVDQIKAALRNKIIAVDGFTNAEFVYFDPGIMISKDNGITWAELTNVNMPADGIDILIPYEMINGLPTNMNAETLAKYEFAAAQMSSFANDAGNVKLLNVKKTETGLNVRVLSNGPLAIGIKQTPKYVMSGSIKGYSGNETISISVSPKGSLADQKTVTADKGKYRVAGLEAGEYIVEVTANGCISESFDIEINDDTIRDIYVYLIGDANQDGKITADDVTAIARHIAKIDVCEDPFALRLYDTDRSGRVSAEDVTHLARYLAQIIDSL